MNTSSRRHKSDRLHAVLFSGTVAALTSSLVLLVMGRLERGRALATHNGPSQWIHGTAAGYRKSVSIKHTLPGFVIHHASSCWWAWVHHALFDSRRSSTLAVRLGEGALTATLAGIVDYGLVPERLQPGFEKHVCRASVLGVYLAFGAGLGVAMYLQQRNDARLRRDAGSNG